MGVALWRSAPWLGLGDGYSVMRLSVMLIHDVVFTATSHEQRHGHKGRTHDSGFMVAEWCRRGA